MDWYDNVFELIDTRSFSNLWFWIALAVLWSSASHWVLGVPWDIVSRGHRQGGVAQSDVEAMVAINVRRLLFISVVAGLWIVSFAAFVLTALGVLGFVYWIELAQALFLLGFPLIFVALLTLRTARRIEAEAPAGEALFRVLLRHRVAVQGIGMVAILCAALFGMWHNMYVPVL